jgi:hypothetical protein
MGILSERAETRSADETIQLSLDATRRRPLTKGTEEDGDKEEDEKDKDGDEGEAELLSSLGGRVVGRRRCP